jgi:hypothetical protein
MTQEQLMEQCHQAKEMMHFYDANLSGKVLQNGKDSAISLRNI